jgi:hypothetical protein
LGATALRCRSRFVVGNIGRSERPKRGHWTRSEKQSNAALDTISIKGVFCSIAT